MEKIRHIVTFFLIMSGAFIHAQQPVIIGTTLKIHSKILDQEREIDLQLPLNYDNPEFAKASFPVLYVLDGEMNFPLVAALERFDTKFMYRPHPEMIVVGIRNIDRTKDYTPTAENHSDGTGKRFETAGGADNFMKFIREELKPYLRSHYRTNGFDLLHGHSFGGLFTLYTLAKDPTLFNAYIAIDPSLWWDDKRVVRQIEQNMAATDYKKRSLFVAIAQEAPDAPKDKQQHSATIRNFCEIISRINPEKNLYSYHKYYPDYDHGAVPVAATLDALKQIFQGIELPVKIIPENPDLVSETYRNISEKLNFRFQPEESLLYQLIRYTDKTNQTENARKLLNFALGLYPESVGLQKLKN